MPDTDTKPAVNNEHWPEGDKDALPSNDDDGKFKGIVF